MADGFTLEIDADLAERLKAAAEAAGESVEVFARSIIQHGLEDDWAEDFRRLAEYEATGEWVSIDEAFGEARAELEKRLAARD